jgi:DNA-binding phage protein
MIEIRGYVLIGGGTKKHQAKDVAAAKECWTDYKRRKKQEAQMPLTHDFKETIRARSRADPEFRRALLRESIECFVNGELSTGRAVLRDYVNATVGFTDLEQSTRIPAKSLMRMLGPKGSPSVENLSRILTALRMAEGVRFTCAIALHRSNRSSSSQRSALASQSARPLRSRLGVGGRRRQRRESSRKESKG